MSDKKCPTANYGGQAVVEGVMMRGKNYFAVACRKKNGEIITTCEECKNNIGVLEKLIKIPFLRGFVALIDSMILGTKTLMYSADIAIADEENEQKSARQQQKTEEIKNKAKHELEQSGNKVNGFLVGFSAFIGIIIGICLFMFIPILITKLLTDFLHLNVGRLIFALFEGIFKFLIFIGYVWCISFMPDVQRIFRYHGAEHKTINCYEAGKELNTENVQTFSTVNPRCGTSFLLIFISISIILFCFVPNPYEWGKFGIIIRFGMKIILLPIIAGIAYECIKFSGQHKDSIFTKTIMAPGLLMQKLTTKEPDDSMVECAIKSLKLVIEKEKQENNI